MRRAKQLSSRKLLFDNDLSYSIFRLRNVSLIVNVPNPFAASKKKGKCTVVDVRHHSKHFKIEQSKSTTDETKASLLARPVSPVINKCARHEQNKLNSATILTSVAGSSSTCRFKTQSIDLKLLLLNVAVMSRTGSLVTRNDTERTYVSQT